MSRLFILLMALINLGFVPMAAAADMAAAFYLPGLDKFGTPYVRITNTTDAPTSIIATLYNEQGQVLGTANSVVVSNLAPQATQVFSRSELAAQFNISQWTGMAWLEITAPTQSVKVMNMLRNPNTTLTNVSASAKDAVHNLPNSTSSDQTAVLVINPGTTPLTVHATLYAQTGAVLGTPDAILVNTLPAKGIQVLTAKALETVFNTPVWTGRSRLVLTDAQSGVLLMGTVLAASNTLTNLTETNTVGLFNLPPSNSPIDRAFARFTNTTNTAFQVKGLLYHQDGQLLGSESLLVTLNPQETQVLDPIALERLFSLSQPWTGRARLVITQPSSGLQIMGLIRSLDGTLNNVSRVEENAAFNLPPSSSNDKAFVRITNTTTTPQTIYGTLYAQDGHLLGKLCSPLIENLAADSTRALDVPSIQQSFGVTPWTGRARLVITQPSTGLRIMSLIRTPNGILTNMSGTTPFIPETPVSGTPDGTNTLSNITVSAGQTASFSVIATDGTAYKWFVDKQDGHGFVEITSTGDTQKTEIWYDGSLTSATLNLRAVPRTCALETNGYQYRVQLTDACGNVVNSNSATLTVTGYYTNYNEVTFAGLTWMDRNLGAEQVATAFDDAASFGDLYQWGRGSDGHQCRNSVVTPGPLADPVVSSNFITTTGSPGDWRTPQDDTLWNSAGFVNNPCPTGFRVPTQAEWNIVVTALGSPADYRVALATNIFIPSGGSKLNNTADFSQVGTNGLYWSRDTAGLTTARRFTFSQFITNTNSNVGRGSGVSVRCVQ